ncbi:MAG: hypothetical protein FWE16_00040 [Firmicutes bacterium]|nr:hypothetical protein [Bacillota bacterium]
MKQPIYLDADSQKRLEDAIEEARQELEYARKVANEVTERGSVGDPSVTYEQAAIDEGVVGRKLQTLLDLKHYIQPVARGNNRNLTDIGDTVNATVNYPSGPVEISYVLAATTMLAGNAKEMEASGKVSVNGPLGGAMWKKQEGQGFSFPVGKNKVTGTVNSFIGPEAELES